MKRKALHKASLAATIMLVLAVLVVSFKQFTTASTAKLVADQKAACTLDPQQFLNTVNRWRAAKGVAPLQYSSQLQAAALARIADMKQYQYYGHMNPVTKHDNGYFTKQYDPTATWWDEVLDGPNNADMSLANFKNSQPHYLALTDPKESYLGLVSMYMPETWAEYDNSGNLQVPAGKDGGNCIVIGQLADKAQR